MSAPIEASPTARPAGCPFDPPTEPAELRESRPLVRMVCRTGTSGGLATGHELVRAALADDRFSARYELTHFPSAGALGELPSAPPGDLTGTGSDAHRLEPLRRARAARRVGGVRAEQSPG